MAALTVTPVALTAYPGFENYPNLLARVFIIVNADRSATLARYYQIHGKLVPNLAFDTVGAFLVGLGMSVEQAGRIFAGLSILVFCGGTLLLGLAAQRRLPWPALWVFAIVLNGYVGLPSYIFGLGIAFGGLGLWLMWPRENTAATIVLSLLPCLLLLCHLIAAGVYALAVASFALDRFAASDRRADDHRKLLAEALAFLPAVLLYALFFEHKNTFGFSYEDPLKSKLEGVYSLFCTADGQGWDFPLITLLVAALAALPWRAGIAFASREAAAATAALFAGFLLAPHWLLGIWIFDSRLALPLLCFALAFFNLRHEEVMGPKTAAVLLLLLSAAVVERSSATLRFWQFAAQSFAGVRLAMAPIETGARIATVQLRAANAAPHLLPPAAASFAIIDHAAFVPELDAFPLSQDGVAFDNDVVEDVRRFRGLVLDGAADSDWGLLARKFDYVLVLGPQAASAAPSVLRHVSGGKDFALFAVLK